MSDNKKSRCPLSDPAQPHYLTRRFGSEIKHDCISCGRSFLDGEKFHYYCTKCEVELHRNCLEFPSKIIHPYHPQHPLTFTFLNNETGIITTSDFGWVVNYSDFIPLIYLNTITPKPSFIFDICTWCRENLSQWFYRCSVCNFSLDFRCASKIPPFTIQNPKSHHHPLALFPRPLSFPCDACGLINLGEPSYACYQCNYMVHQSCIDLPRVIKITRHPHRLSFTPYLLAKLFSCRVCYKKVDIKYGSYSCNHEDCSYIVHSKCATRDVIWDGEELEWEGEESGQTEDIEPFKKVGVDLIDYFSHHHYLKLVKYNGIRDPKKQCQACIRPINSHDFYSCIECDFFLHEVCANLPRKLSHALHNHPLFMDPYPPDNYRDKDCSACGLGMSGFKYVCRKEECNSYRSSFQLDINCILVPECFTHKSHAEHPVFISIFSSGNNHAYCQGCQHYVGGIHLDCTLCDFVICYRCAVIPNEIYHKYDEYPLFLCYGESEVGSIYWCEVCEKSLDPKEWFYTSKESCTTIHHKCLFPDSAYMKPGHIMESDYYGKLEVVGNGSSSRPICCRCHKRCPQPVYFKVYGRDQKEVDMCHVCCLERRRSFLYG